MTRKVGSWRRPTRQTFAYDANGRIGTHTLSDGQVLEYIYDESGGVSSIRQNGIPISAYTRNANGNPITKTDALGRVTRYEWDSRDNLLAEHLPNGATTQYEYDGRNMRTAQIDGNGNRVEFRYDTAGRLIRQTNAIGQVLTWTYDDKGRLIRRTNGVQTVTWTYNSHHRLKKVDYGVPGEQIVYSYDEHGRVRRAATATNSVTFFYDSLSRIIARQFQRDKTERVVRYQYNALNQKTAVTLSEKLANPVEGDDGYRILQQNEYGYDPAGRLTELKSNGVTICLYQYDDAGRLAGRAYGNGIVATYAYDRFGRQSRLDLSGGPLLEPMALIYEWDAVGQLLSRTWNKEKLVYRYDPSGKLLTVTKAVAPTSDIPSGPAIANETLEWYKYDAAGNILSKFENGEETAMCYNAGNQLVNTTTADVTATFQYDAAGRMVSKTVQGKTESRTYGFLDKLLILNKPDGTRISYDYYPDGHLAAKAPLIDEIPNANAIQVAFNRNIAEELIWDNLALLYKNGTGFAIEPHVNGGVPIAASRDIREAPLYYINDILGTTLATAHEQMIQFVPLTAFGSPVKTKSDRSSNRGPYSKSP